MGRLTIRVAAAITPNYVYTAAEPASRIDQLPTHRAGEADQKEESFGKLVLNGNECMVGG